MIIGQLWGVATHTVVETLHSSDEANKTISSTWASLDSGFSLSFFSSFECMPSLSRDYGEWRKFSSRVYLNTFSCYVVIFVFQVEGCFLIGFRFLFEFVYNITCTQSSERFMVRIFINQALKDMGLFANYLVISD